MFRSLLLVSLISTLAPRAAAQAGPPTEVTVVGTRVESTAGSAHVVTKKQLEQSEYDDAGAILQQVPGVYVRQEDGVGLRPNLGLRGANPDRSKKVTLMEDGILFGPAPYSAPAAYYFPLMTRMSAVRVIKGPAAVAFGPQTVGGAVDFVSRPIPSQASGALDFGYGEYGYTKADGWFGWSDEQTGVLLSGTNLHNEGFKELPSGADTGSTRNDWLIKARYVFDPAAEQRNELILKLAYADETSNETYLGLTDADLRADPDRRYPASQLDQMSNHRASAVLFHEYSDPRARLALKSAVYHHNYWRVWRKANQLTQSPLFDVLTNPGDPTNAGYLAVLRGDADSAAPSEHISVGPNDRTFVSQGIQTVLQQTRSWGATEHRYELGTRLHYDEIRRRHSQSGFEVRDRELIPDGGPEQVTAANTDRTHALALHAIDAMTWHRLTITPGIRAELIASRSDDHLAASSNERSLLALMPGLGAYLALWPSFGVLSGVYRGFSPPPPGSDAEVSPEYSVNYEAGARYASGRARAELIGFYNDYQNLTDVCTFSSGCLTENLDRQIDAGRAHIWGVEAFAQHEPSSGRLRFPLRFAYTFTRARFANSFESQDPIWGEVQNGDEIPYVPRHQLNATAGIEHERVGGYVSLGYVSAMREAPGQEPLAEALATDSQRWFDIGVQGRVWASLRLYANLRNAWNERDIVSHRPYGARPSAPRWLQVGAKLDL